MKNIKHLTIFALSITIAACSQNKKDLPPAEKVGLRITAEVPTDVTANQITVIPNDVAPWLSQILLLSDGKLYRTSARGGQTESVKVDNLKDVIGLMRAGEAGTALGLTQNGKLTALIEKDDEGRLARMNISAKSTNYDGFCKNPKAPVKTATAFSGKNLITLELSYEGNDVMTVTELNRSTLSKPISSCYVSAGQAYVIADGELFLNEQSLGTVSHRAQNLTAIEGLSAPTLLYTEDVDTVSTLRAEQPGTRRNVVIEDGLSVLGTMNMSGVFATADNLGGTFNEGAIIAQDSKSERLILVALPFAQRTLSQQSMKP